MTSRRSLVLVALLATLHGLFFIWYQRPDWNTQWPDQDGYRRLGQVLAETGKFTRFPDAPQFVPEVIRTPMYPIFVAAIYKVAGTRQLPVALAQTALFVLICLVVHAIVRAVATERTAIAAATATALFPPIPYFAALVLTEVWTTFLFTVAIWFVLLAVRRRDVKTFAIAGVLLAAATLSRPVFVLFPIALAVAGAAGFALMRVARRPALSHWAVMLAAFGLTMLPWFTYNYVTLGRFTLSPAGGVGRGLWEGSWQATWSGRLQNELTQTADDIDDRMALDRAVQSIAVRERLPAEPMLTYVHQWRDIRRIWTEPTDPNVRAQARVEADREYLRVGLDNVRRTPPRQLVARLARGVFILWAGEIPFRYSQINELPPIVIRLVWALQVMICATALAGVWTLARTGHRREALVLALPIVYLTAVHMPLLKEARQSLPAQPLVLALATVGIGHMRTRLLSREPQVHERQHLRQPAGGIES